ncbi:MAG: agmatinase [Candidatus Thermoplasmatota archaeon]|nr:agmatinase [Candidatus Thermoplasmatota archaeon]
MTEFFSFLKLPDANSTYGSSRYVIFGVPFDGTSSFRKGSKFAPDAVRIAWDNLESFDFSTGSDISEARICDLGNLKEESAVEFAVDSVETVTRMIKADGRIPIMMGGEHSITVGAIRNFRNCGMIIVDAHSDFRESYHGNKLNHACVTRRALELLGPNRIVSIGTRSVSREEYESEDFKKVRFISAEEVREKGIEYFIEEIRGIVGDRIYFSIDMDGIDPAYAPAVGTPEPYGLKDTDVRHLLKQFSTEVVGFDIVEFSPQYDQGNTAMLAAKLIEDFISINSSKLNP